MDLQVSTTDILMILDGHANQLRAALSNPQTLNTEGLKNHVARMYAYADKLHEIAEAASTAAQAKGEAGVAN